MSTEKLCKYLLFFGIFMTPQGASVASFQIGGWSVTSFRLAYFLILMLMSYCVFIRNGSIKISNKKNVYSVQFLFVWVGYALLTAGWMVEPVNWVRQLTYVVTGLFGTIFCVNFLKSKEDVITAVKVFQWALVPQIILGWNEVLRKVYYFCSDVEQVENYSRGIFGMPVGSQGNTNDFATLMYLGVILSCICFFHSQKIWRFIYFCCFVSEIILIALTGSRANYVGLGLAFCFMLFMVGRKRLAYYLALLGIACYGVLTLASLLGIEIVEQVDRNLYFGQSGSDDVRLGLIMNGFYFLFRTFGLGVGPGQIESWMETESIFYRGYITNMHNYWMEIMTSYGFVIFIGFFVFYYRMWRDMLRESARHITIKDKILSLGIAAMMAGWVIASVSPSSVIKYDWLWAFWAIAIAYQGMLGEGKSGRIDNIGRIFCLFHIV